MFTKCAKRGFVNIRGGFRTGQILFNFLSLYVARTHPGPLLIGFAVRSGRPLPKGEFLALRASKIQRRHIHLFKKTKIMPAKRILHIAPQNISDVPMTFVRAERALGFESRLVTFFRDPRGYAEDLCLNLPFVNTGFVKKIKRFVSAPVRLKVQNAAAETRETPPVWQANGIGEKWLVSAREWIWEPKIYEFMLAIDFWTFDQYQFDAGLDFFRDGRFVRQLKTLGKKVIVCYTGSDLRTRGIIEPVDNLADLRITVEWDHLDLHAGLRHILFPFEPERFVYRERPRGHHVRIGHAPTNRAAKGSGGILEVLRRIARERHIEIVLIENKTHSEALNLKASCDIFIDQIGDLGYGINALEALALGVPSCTCLTPRFLAAYPRHPFWEINGENLYERLLRLIDSENLCKELSGKGRAWLEAHHDSRNIVRRVQNLLGDSLKSGGIW